MPLRSVGFAYNWLTDPKGLMERRSFGMRHGKPAMMVAALVAAAVSLVWALGPAATTVRAADAQLSPGDVDFLQRLHQVNMTELTFAKWAVDTKTWQGSAAVQAVGKQLQADHTEIDKQTVAMACRRRPPTSSSGPSTRPSPGGASSSIGRSSPRSRAGTTPR